MDTAFIAVLTSMLLWKPCPGVALEDHVLVWDSSLSQWSHLVLEVWVSISILLYPEESSSQFRDCL